MRRARRCRRLPPSRNVDAAKRLPSRSTSNPNTHPHTHSHIHRCTEATPSAYFSLYLPLAQVHYKVCSHSNSSARQALKSYDSVARGGTGGAIACGWEVVHQRFAVSGKHPSSRKLCNYSLTLSPPSGPAVGILCLHVHNRGAIVQTLHLMPHFRCKGYSALLWSAAKHHAMRVLEGAKRTEFMFSLEETCARTLRVASFWITTFDWEASPDCVAALETARRKGRPPMWWYGGEFSLSYTVRTPRRTLV